jgi:hypothetical protein
MIWILWALLLVTHGALSRWTRTSQRRFALAAFAGDCLLITIGLITIDQLQGMSLAETVRVGLFFAAFGTCGRQLMRSILERQAPSNPA